MTVDGLGIVCVEPCFEPSPLLDSVLYTLSAGAEGVGAILKRVV